MIVITVARKSVEGTVAQNVATYGTGGINIDACRVGTSKRVPESAKKMPASTHTVSLPGGKITDSGFNPNIGRWPTNLVLQHLPQCHCDGVKEVPGKNATLKNTQEGTFIGQIGPTGLRKMPPGEYGHAVNGKETILNWECYPGCPVCEMDAQSGLSKSSSPDRPTNRTSSGGTGACYVLPGDSPGYGDVGTASRYFKQVKPE